MKIYTKTGDQGRTGLFQGPRILKNDPRINAYGTVDELNSIVGLLRTTNPSPEMNQILQHLQEVLFELGSDLATPMDNKDVTRFSAAHIETLEQQIDQWEQELEPLASFILPGGSSAAAYAHLARTVCRRAERCCIELLEASEIHIPSYQFLNRLSDWFFVLARRLNQIEGIQDIKWES